MLEKRIELCMKDVISLDSKCYIDDYPDINDNDEEIYPEFIADNGLELIYRDKLIQDVVISCLEQKKSVSLEEIMIAINYYDENDCFLKL